MNPPVVEQVGKVLVVRDDLVLGGTKARVLHRLFEVGKQEYVYASPVQGYAQVALAYCCRAAGKQATVFCAARREHHPRTEEALLAGAKVVEVSPGYLSVVRARACEYCDRTGAVLLPFGLDVPVVVDAIANVARGLGIAPTEVWTVAGSGVLTRALQKAWPDAAFNAVRIGAEPDAGRARVWVAPEKYEHDARHLPPFPSCTNYDAKLWQFVLRYASPGALVWNVAK